MSRATFLSLPLLLVALAGPAAADDRDTCLDGKVDGDSRLAACDRAIAGGKWRGNDLARLHVVRADRFRRQRGLDQSLDDCNAAITADPKLASGYRCRGEIYFERQEFDRAIAEHARAIGLSPRYAHAYVERGRAHAGKHDWPQAMADYGEAIKITPAYAQAYQARALAHYQQGQYDRAIADFNEAIKHDPKYLLAYYNRSRAFVRKRDLERALADAEESIRIDPRYLFGHLQRGYVLKEMREHDRALAAFERAAEADPKSPRPLVGRAEVLVDRKDYDQAIAALDSAIRIEPSQGLAYGIRGNVYYRRGDLERAMQDLNEAVKAAPRSSLAYNNRGLAQHARRDYDEAIADFTEAIRLDPANAAAYSNRGRTYNARKEFDRAIKDLDESIRLNPAGPIAHSHRAASYENKRSLDKALADWRSVQRLEPGNASAIKAIQRLEQEIAAPGARKGRVALVIGNGEYKSAGRLANPVNDAGDVAAALRRLGFEVIEGRDLGKRAMEERIAEFARKLDKAGIGLFFYAGHGIQVDGDNWLIPVDAPIEASKSARDRAAVVRSAAVNVGQVVAKMEAEQRVNLIFLDACRDNPFGKDAGPAQAKGLAPIQNSVGTLTAFATKPYHVAFDGEGRNSPFTSALLRHISTPGLEIGGVMKRVRSDVIKTTKGEQVPFDESSLITDVVLVQ